MTLTIGSIDQTGALQEGSLSLRYYGALRSTFTATLSLPEPGAVPLVGEEILVKEGEEVLWGGILIETEIQCHSISNATVTLRGQGYEHLLQRYCFPAISLEEMTPSAAAIYIFENNLLPIDGLTLGTVDPGPGQKNIYSFYPAKASSVFDYLAKENGYRWWVDRDKRFFMRGQLPSSDASISIDLTGASANSLKDLQTLVFRSSTAGYRNNQYAFNKSRSISGKAVNVEQEIKMRARYGSGHYGAVSESSIIYSASEATALAAQILETSPGTDEIEFTTDYGGLVLGQELSVTAPICGIESPELFRISEIRAIYFFDRFRYTVIANQSAESVLSAGDWEQTLAGRTIN